MNDLFTVNRLIGLVGRVFANGPGDLGSKWSNLGKGVVPSLTPLEKGAFWSPSTKGDNFTIWFQLCRPGRP